MCWPWKIGIAFATKRRVFSQVKDAVKKIRAIESASALGSVNRAAGSPEDELTKILPSILPALYRIPVRKVGNAEDGEDDLQDALLRSTSRCKYPQNGYASSLWGEHRAAGKAVPRALHWGTKRERAKGVQIFPQRGRSTMMALALQVVTSHLLGALDIESAISILPALAKRLLPHAAGEADALKRPRFPRLFVLDGCSLTLPLGPLSSRLRANSPGSKFFVLLPPERSEIAEMIRLFHWGIDGMLVLDKKWKKELPKAVLAVLTNRVWVPSDVLLAFVHQMKILLDRQLPPGQSLTTREGQVLQLLFRQFTNKEIARELKISERTAKFHVSNLLSKLDLESRKNLETFGQLESI